MRGLAKARAASSHTPITPAPREAFSLLSIERHRKQVGHGHMAPAFTAPSPCHIDKGLCACHHIPRPKPPKRKPGSFEPWSKLKKIARPSGDLDRRPGASSGSGAPSALAQLAAWRNAQRWKPAAGGRSSGT